MKSVGLQAPWHAFSSPVLPRFPCRRYRRVQPRPWAKGIGLEIDFRVQKSVSETDQPLVFTVGMGVLGLRTSAGRGGLRDEREPSAQGRVLRRAEAESEEKFETKRKKKPFRSKYSPFCTKPLV